MKNRFEITRFSWLAAMTALLSILVFSGEAKANYLFYNADTGREVFSNAVEAPSLYVLSGNISLGASYVIGSGSGYGCTGCSQSGTIELYNNSTGKMTIQSGTSYSLLLNPSGGNVGIGTSTPAAKLDVAGGSVVTSTSGSGLYIGPSSQSYVLGDSGASGNLRLGTVGAERARIDALGNLGLGTTSPTQKLHIIDTSNPAINGSVIIEGRRDGAANVLALRSRDADASSSALPSDEGPVVRFQGFDGTGFGDMGAILSRSKSVLSATDHGGYLSFYTVADGSTTLTENVRIDHDGKVGIGTTSPQAKLDVFQSGAINTTTPGTTRYGLHLTPQNTTVDTAVGITFGAGDSGLGQTAQAGIYSQFSGSYGTKMYFATTDQYSTGAKIRMMIDHSGNLGIGTNSPASALDVRKAITASGLAANGTNLQQTLTAAANNDVLSALKINPTFVPGAFTGVTQYAINATGTIKGTAFEGALSGTVNSGNVSSGSFGLNTGGGNYTFPANVGIGMTTAPENWLHIKNATKDTTTSPNEVGLTLESAVSTNQKYQLGVGVSGISNQYFSLRDITAGAYRMVVNTSGYVGIGTTSPNAILHVATSGGITPIRATNSDYNGTTAGSGFGISFGAATGDTYTKLQAFDAGGASSSDLILQSSGGNVGIGTTTPGGNLDVHAAIAGASPLLRISNDGTAVGTPTLSLYRNSADSGEAKFVPGGGGFIFNNTRTTGSSDIIFQNNNGVERMRIGDTGNIGIGVAAPTAGLDVQKAITASGLAANGVNLQQTLTASANNDVLTALKVNPTFVPGIYTGVTQYAIDATGTIKGTAFEGALSGTVNSGNVSAGSFGLNTGGGNYTFPANLTVDTDTLFVDSVNNMVGVGTLTPGAKLDVRGLIQSINAGVTMAMNQNVGGSSGTIGTVSNHGLQIRTNDTLRMFISDAGNVGIGTASPVSKFEIADATNAGFFRVDTWGTLSAGYNAYTLNRLTWDGSGVAAHGQMYLKMNNADYVKLDASGVSYFNGGNVGVGTASPGAKLDVQDGGSVTLDGLRVKTSSAAGSQASKGALIVQGYGSGQTGTSLVTSSRTTGTGFGLFDVQYSDTTGVGSGTSALYVRGDGKVGLGTTSPSQKLDVVGGVKMTTLNQGAGTNERFYPNVVSSAQDAQVTGAWIINTPIPRASNQMFRIRVHGYGYGNQDSIDFTIVGYPYSGAVGSVDGLGGAIVNYDLQDNGTDGLEKWVGVNSSGNLAIALGNTTTGAYYYRISVDAWVTRTTTDYSTGWSVAQSIVSGFGFLDIKGPLTSSLKNTIFVNSTGNVGIGQSSPTVKLDVSGEVKATTFTGTYAGTINSGNVSAGSFGLNTGGGNYTFPANLTVDTDTLFVDSVNNRVGVGTSSPWAKLQVAAPSGTTSTFNILDSSSGYAWSFYNVTNGLGTDLRIYETTSAADRITIAKGGYLGIGQTVPVANLDILGANASLIKITRSSVANANIQYSNGTYNMYAGLNPAGNFGISSSADLTSAPFIVTSAGLVGVSQPTPTTTLDVGGVINATTGYRVAGAATSGYYLRGNGTNFVSAQIQASDIPSGAIAAGTLSREDNRQISPSELTAGNLKFGFTAYNNNNASPYADFLHLRSYTDSSGGSDNLLMFNKTDGLGMRLYQQSYGSATAYATYKDVVLANNTPTANYLTKYSGGATTVSVTNSQVFDNGTNVGIGTAAPAAKFAVTGNMFLGNLEADQGYSLTWRGRNDLGIDEDAYSLVIGAPEGIRINLDSNNNTTGTNFEIAKDVNAKTGGTVLFMVRESDGFVGIAKTNPATALDVNGTVTATSFSGALTGTVSAGNVSSGTFGLNTGYGNFTFAESASPNNPILHVDALNGRVGIGTTSPGSSLQISTSNQFRVYVSEGIILPTYYYLGDINYNNGMLKVSGILGGHTQAQGRADVNLTFSVRDAFTALGNVWGAVGTGSDIVVYNDTVASKYKVYLKTDDYGLVNLTLTAASGATVGYTGSGSTTAPAYTLAYTLSTDAGGVVRSLTDGNVGIGIIPTADPSGYNLDVGPGGSYTARLGTSSADTVLIGGGAGKLNVGTIDPIYTIGAKRYATYTTAMTGVKEETSGTIRLQKTGSRYMATLNFGSAEEGSDLWLFYQVTDFDSKWDGLSVLLSSGFDGSVWYEKDAAKKVIHIYGAPTVASALSSGEPMEVSYRLTAPRFDHRKWSNYSEDEAEGFKLDVKE